jgi:hypothetical protein
MAAANQRGNVSSIVHACVANKPFTQNPPLVLAEQYRRNPLR